MNSQVLIDCTRYNRWINKSLISFNTFNIIIYLITVIYIQYYNITSFITYVYKLSSICDGIGSMVMFNSSSTRNRLCLSSSVTKLTASPRWPNLPDLPILCRYVSEFLGKSKFMTTFTAKTSMPLVNKSDETKHRQAPVLKSWYTWFLWLWGIWKCWILCLIRCSPAIVNILLV